MRPGDPWGEPADTDPTGGVQVVGGDPDLARAAGDHPGALLRFAPDATSDLARALGVTGTGTDSALATQGADRLAVLCAECGIRPGLAHHGIPADAIARLAAEGMKVARLLKNNPRELTLADAETIFRQAF